MVATERTNQSQYNLNEQTMLLIADLQREAILSSNKKDFYSAFDCWQSIRILIQSRFEDNERKELDKLEKEFIKPIPMVKPSKIDKNFLPSGNIMKEVRERKYNQIRTNIILRTRLNDYVEELMNLMRDYSIGLTDKERKRNLN